MAANGLINGFEKDFGGDASFMQGIPQGVGGFPRPVQMPGIPRDEGVDQIAQAFKTYLTQNQHIERDAPNVDTFDAFKAGVEFGSGPLFTPTPPPVVEEFGTPYVAPNVDEFEGFAEEGTPGFADPKNEYEQRTPGFSLDPNDPRNAYLNQGGMVPAEDFTIDMSDILGTASGQGGA
jgi:hypothetical protein